MIWETGKSCVKVSRMSLTWGRKKYIEQDNFQRTRSLSNAANNAIQNISIQIYLHDLDI